MNNRILILMPLLLLCLVLNCKKDQPTAPETSIEQYGGTWTGTTGQGLPIYIHITQAGMIDSLTVRISVYVGLSSCTGTFTKDSVCSLKNGSFVARVMLPGSSLVTRVRGSLSSSSSGSGTYDGYGGSFSLICGSSFMIGTSGSLIGKASWTVSKSG